MKDYQNRCHHSYWLHRYPWSLQDGVQALQHVHGAYHMDIMFRTQLPLDRIPLQSKSVLKHLQYSEAASPTPDRLHFTPTRKTFPPNGPRLHKSLGSHMQSSQETKKIKRLRASSPSPNECHERVSCCKPESSLQLQGSLVNVKSK